MKAIIGKQYQHSKGHLYTVLSIARSEPNPDTELAMYRAEYVAPDYGNECVWARERKNWEGNVVINNGEEDRFTELKQQ